MDSPSAVARRLMDSGCDSIGSSDTTVVAAAAVRLHGDCQMAHFLAVLAKVGEQLRAHDDVPVRRLNCRFAICVVIQQAIT